MLQALFGQEERPGASPTNLREPNVGGGGEHPKLTPAAFDALFSGTKGSVN